MSKAIHKSTAAKVVAGFAGLTMAFTFAFGGVATVNAQTSADLQAQIQSLLQTIAQLQAQMNTVEGGSSMSGLYCNFSFLRDLAQGATGSDVMDLQKFLNSAGLTVAVSGAGSAGMETSYYGPATAAAVSKFQVQYASEILAPLGLTSGTGYFGASSRAKARAVCAAAPTTPTTPTTPSTGLKGGAGSLSDVDFVSGLNNEEVGEDESDVEVAGIDIEADGSDLEITAVTIDFDQVTAGEDFEDYASEVTIWLDGEMFASVDADEFQDDDNFSKTVSLDKGAIIRENDEGRLVVAVSGVKNLDSTDAGDTWNVQFTSVRYRDAQGSVISDTSTGDIDSTSDNSTVTASYEREFSFETFATAADSELVVKLASDNLEARVVNVDTSSDTNNVELLRFTLEAEGDSDIRVRDLPVLLTVTGVADVDLIANAITVTIDGEEYSETISTSSLTAATITLEDFDYTIDAGDTVEVVVTVDINDLESTFGDGDTIKAEVRSFERAAIDADDESGEALVAGDRSGTALGEAVALYDVAPMITLVSVTESVVDGGVNGFDGTGTFTIKYDVTAVDGDVFVSDTAVATVAASGSLGTGVDSESVLYTVDKSGTPTADDLSAVVTFTKNGNNVTDTGVTGVKITEGSTGKFTLTVTRTNDNTGDSGLYRMALRGVSWATASGAATNIYTFNLEDYETNYVSIN